MVPIPKTTARRTLGLLWVSTAESFEANKVTWLALIEFGFATVIATLIVVDGRYLPYFFVAALMLCFLLLRTERSTSIGLDFLGRWEGLIERTTPDQALTDIPIREWRVRLLATTLLNGVTFFTTPLVAIAIRAFATILGCIETPKAAMVEIPGNWFRQVFCLDSWYPPELVPGKERKMTGSLEEQIEKSSPTEMMLTFSSFRLALASAARRFPPLEVLGYRRS